MLNAASDMEKILTSRKFGGWRRVTVVIIFYLVKGCSRGSLLLSVGGSGGWNRACSCCSGVFPSQLNFCGVPCFRLLSWRWLLEQEVQPHVGSACHRSASAPGHSQPPTKFWFIPPKSSAQAVCSDSSVR